MYLVLFVKKIIEAGRYFKNKIFKVLFITVTLNVVFGSIFYIVEKSHQEGLTIIDSIWWAMVTMTTVGYGDFFPKTLTGRFLVAYPCMLIGIGILGYLIGAVAEFIINRESKKRKGLMDINHTEHVIICNCPSVDKVVNLVGELKADSRFKNSKFVVITNQLNEIPESFIEQKIFFLKGDSTREETLLKANILNCAGVFVLAEKPHDIKSDENTFTIGSIIESISREKRTVVKVVVELVSEENYSMMKRANVDGIISLYGITDCLLIQEFLDPGTNEAIKQIVSNKRGSQIYVLKTKLNNITVGMIRKKIIDVDSDVVLIGVKRENEHIINPSNQLELISKDQLILLGKNVSDFEIVENSF